jgi:phosphate acetyltransferase
MYLSRDARLCVSTGYNIRRNEKMSNQLLDALHAKAKANPKKIAFPEANDEKIIRAAKQALDIGIAFPVLVGDNKIISALAEKTGISLQNIEIIDNTDQEKLDQYIGEYLKAKTDLPANALKRKSKDSMYLALILEEIGKVDGVVAGLNHTTGDVILAAQMIIGMKESITTPSSVGIWAIPGFNGSEGEFLAHADCAVNPDPTAEELADIAISSADTIRTLMNWEPRVAMLSFSTKGSTSHPRVDKVLQALDIARKRRPDLLIDGEFQLDSAISPAVAAKKVKEPSAVAGKANILIFPDLDAGNIGVKLVQNFAKALACGPHLQGFNKPVSDLSRSAPIDDIVGVVSMVVICAQNK